MKRGLALILLLILILLVGSIAVYAVDCSKINSELAEKIRDNIKRGMGPAAENIPKRISIPPGELLKDLQVPKIGVRDFKIKEIKANTPAQIALLLKEAGFEIPPKNIILVKRKVNEKFVEGHTDILVPQKFGDKTLTMRFEFRDGTLIPIGME